MKARSSGLALLPIAATLTRSNTIPSSVVQQMMQSVTQYGLQQTYAWAEVRMVGQEST